MNVEKSLLFYLSLLVVIFEMFHQFVYISPLSKGYLYSILWLVACLLLRVNLYKRKLLLLFFIFYIFSFFYYKGGGDYYNLSSSTQLVLLFTYYVLPPSLYMFYHNYLSEKQIKITLILVLSLFVFTLAATYNVAINNPNLIRQMAVDAELSSEMSVLGVISYSLSHSVLFLIPSFVFLFKSVHNLYTKSLSIVLMGLVFLAIYLGGSTTPLILAVFLTILSFIYNANKSVARNVGVVIMLSFVLLVFLEKSFLSSMLDFIYPIFQDTPFEGKIIEFQDSLYYGDLTGNDIDARQGKLSDSISAFFDNPLFGNTTAKLGNHNYFIDLLAAVGIIGMIPLVSYLYVMSRMIFRTLSQQAKPYFVFGIASFVLLGLLKNFFGIEFFLVPFYLMPLFIKYAEKKSYN